MKLKILFICSLFLPLGILAKEKDFVEDSKEINRSFKVNPGAEVEITNKYGDVDIYTHEMDCVLVNVVITASAEKYQYLDDMIENTDVHFFSGDGFVSAETTYGSTSRILKNEILTALSSKRKLRIDYRIYIPKGADLFVDNKFGNINLPDITGELNIKLAHGDLRAKNIEELDLLRIEYGDARIEVVEEGEIEARFSDVSIENGGDIRIGSIHGDLDLEDIETLNLDSKYDKIRIEEIESIELYTSFTDVKIEELKRRVEADVKFGEFRVKKVHPGAEYVRVQGSNTDVDIDFDSNASFEYEASLSHSRRFSVSDANHEVIDRDEYDSYLNQKGTVNKQGGAEPTKVTVDLKFAYVGLGIDD